MRWPKARCIVALLFLAAGVSIAFFARSDEFYFLRPLHPTERLVKARTFDLLDGQDLSWPLPTPTWRVFEFHCPPAAVAKVLDAHPEVAGENILGRRPETLERIKGEFGITPDATKSGGITCQLVIWPETDDRPWYARAWDGIKGRLHL